LRKRGRGESSEFTDHLGLTRDPAFVDNALYLLLEDARRSSVER